MNLILNILKKIPLFESLSEAEHESMLEHITMQYYPAHYKLFEEGVVGSALYIIKSGTVRIYKGGQDLATLNEGDFFGEMALIEQKPRMAGAETLSDSEIFVLEKDDFAELVRKTPGIAQKVEEAYLKRKTNNDLL